MKCVVVHPRSGCWLALLSCALLSFSSGCKEKKTSGDPAGSNLAPGVVAATVVQQTVPIYVEYVGETEAKDTVDLRARVQGYLMEIRFQEGGLVKSNDLLFVIDPRPFEADLAKAKADLDNMLATLEKARTDVARLKPLVAEDAVPKQDLDNAEAAHKVAMASVAAVQSAVTNATLNLSWTRVCAPMDGIIGVRNYSAGNYVGSVDKAILATMSSVDPMRVTFFISEEDYLRYLEQHAQPQQNKEPHFELILANNAVYPHRGVFNFADRAVDIRTGTLKMRAEFPNPKGHLRPGQFGRIRMKVDELADAILVPQRAVIEVQGARTALVVSADNKVQQRAILASRRFENSFIVTSGLKPGERVIVEGLQKARPGMTVKPVAETAALPVVKER
ncbi:MAG: efflux RND transporter periplasmic adaptor subunit [Verrucomicrobiia bacterium]